MFPASALSIKGPSIPRNSGNPLYSGGVGIYEDMVVFEKPSCQSNTELEILGRIHGGPVKFNAKDFGVVRINTNGRKQKMTIHDIYDKAEIDEATERLSNSRGTPFPEKTTYISTPTFRMTSLSGSNIQIS